MTRKYSFEIKITDEDKLIACEDILNKMFSTTFFTICEVRKVTQILDIEFSQRSIIYKQYLSPLHCVHFKDMDEKTFSKVKEICYKLIDKYESTESEGEPVEFEYFDDEFV